MVKLLVRHDCDADLKEIWLTDLHSHNEGSLFLHYIPRYCACVMTICFLCWYYESCPNGNTNKTRSMRGTQKTCTKNCHKSLGDLRTSKWVNIKTDLKYMRYENVDAIRLTKKTGEAAHSCQQ